jgi:hypothetical protein
MVWPKADRWEWRLDEYQEVSRTGILKLAEFRDQREQLRQLYEALCLAIVAQKAETGAELTRVRKGKKAVGVYRSNI